MNRVVTMLIAAALMIAPNVQAAEDGLQPTTGWQTPPEEVMEVLMRHGFPGNVRELENVIEHAFVLCRGGVIGLEHLPADLRQAGPGSAERREGPASRPASTASAEAQSLDQLERQAVVSALRRSGGSKSLAAKELGIHRTTLWRKMKHYGLV